jgi:branched-chain amino acid transport system ATP-binding protein
MSDPAALLSARDLSVRFGGVLAVNKVSFDVQRGEVFTLIGPNGAGKTTVFNLISRIYEPTGGTLEFEGRRLNDVPAHAIARLGIARTFQNIELFEHASVLQNLLIGHHVHQSSGFWHNLFFMPTARRAEREARARAEEVIDLLELQHHWCTGCRTACARWSRWRGRCAWGRSCCCSTSRRRG